MKLLVQFILAGVTCLASLANAQVQFCDCCRFVRRGRRSLEETESEATENEGYWVYYDDDWYYDDWYYYDDYTNTQTNDDYSSTNVDDIYAVCTASCGCQPTGGGCFSEKATVQVLQKGVISIQDLEVGDKVLTANHQERYEEVYGFGHYSNSKKMEFLKISTANSDTAPLEITGNHLIYVDGKTHPVRADSIEVGDMLRSQHDTAVPVTKIKKVTKNGVYAPLTPSGTVVVDGVVASSYISLQPDSVEYAEFTNGHKMTWLTQQQGCHMWMSPLRLLCMGVSTSFCEKYDEDGQLFWVHFGQDFLLWGMQYNLLVQAILLGATGVMTTFFYSMELVFGARYAIPMICALVAAWLFSRGFGVVLVPRKEAKSM